MAAAEIGVQDAGIVADGGVEETTALGLADPGGGVIGAGWAARFLLNGVDVAIYDPDPEIERKVAAVLDNARRAAARVRRAPRYGPRAHA